MLAKILKWVYNNDMICCRIDNLEEITKLNVNENSENVDDVKVKITKCYVTKKDVNVYGGQEKHTLPYLPGKIAVAQITEVVSDSNYFTKGQKVYLDAELHNNDIGFLKEFAVINKNSLNILPNNVSEYDALYIHHLALAISIIDELKIDKGEYVAIVGGSVLGNLVGQLLSYYKAVPILIDEENENVETAKKTDIYYSYLLNKNIEKEISDITGGRKCNKVIYITDNDINFDYAIKLTNKNAKIAVAGITQTKQKLNLNNALLNNLNIKFITNCKNNIGTAINLLVQKAINISHFKINEYKFEYVSKHFENSLQKLKTKKSNPEFIVDLL